MGFLLAVSSAVPKKCFSSNKCLRFTDDGGEFKAFFFRFLRSADGIICSWDAYISKGHPIPPPPGRWQASEYVSPWKPEYTGEEDPGLVIY